MLFNTLVSFLLLALTPLFAFAQSEGSSSTTTTVSTTITSTATSYVTMTGYPPSSTLVSSFTTSTLASFLNSTATSSTLTSTFETAMSKSTGSPSNAANGTIIAPTPLASPLPGAAAGGFRASYSLGAGILGVVIFGML